MSDAEGVTTPQELERRVDAMAGVVRDLREENAQLREDFEAYREQAERRFEDLEQQIHELDGRTDLLQLVEAADHADGLQRSVALLMDAKRKIESDDDAHRLEIDHDDAVTALHNPDVARTTIYSDMERAASLVGDPDVARYRDGALRIDLSQGSVEPTIRQHRRGGSP